MYHVTISRKPPLKKKEWKSIIEKTKDLKLTDSIPQQSKKKKKTIDVPMKNSAKWTGHPDGVDYYFVFENHKIMVGEADKQVIKVARKIAEKLDADVRLIPT